MGLHCPYDLLCCEILYLFRANRRLVISNTGPSWRLSVTESPGALAECAEPFMLKPTTSLTERLTQLANVARTRAEAAPPGPQREALLKAARLSENALHIQQWLRSPRPPG